MTFTFKVLRHQFHFTKQFWKQMNIKMDSYQLTFWKDLGRQTMIRATKGTSRRPNHMRSHLDALQTPTPVAFRRFPHSFHSVAKQASFEALFVRVPVGFWKVLVRFWVAQMEVKIDIWEVFRDAFAECVLELIFWWFFEVRTLIILRPASVL